MDPFENVPTTIQFEGASATLSEDGRAAVELVADLLTTRPELTVTLIGHTDNTTTPDNRARLSLARAQAVADALTARGVDAARIVVKGASDSRPVASNADAAGRALNRRVEIRIVKG